MSARNIIRESLITHCGRSPTTKAAFVERDLTASGYRILGPDDLDPVTLERCAKAVEGMSWYKKLSPDHMAGNNPSDYAAAIRALSKEEAGK